jgi:fermentation-respiration switch protein FrsA (DUF1100 family)
MTPARIALGTLGVVLGVVAILALRGATMATHQPVDPDSKLDLVVAARTHGGEAEQTLDEMVNALVLSCRLRVNTDLDGAMHSEGNGHFHGTLSPSLDASNRREFRGCLEDWAIEHLQVDVVSLTEPAR